MLVLYSSESLCVFVGGWFRVAGQGFGMGETTG